MRETRMGRLLLEQFLENGSRLEPVCVGLIGGVLRHGERERVENLRFVIFRELCRDLSHGIAISKQERLLRRIFEVAVQFADRREISAFSIRLCTLALAAFGVLPS